MFHFKIRDFRISVISATVSGKCSKKDLFADPEDTVTRQDLDDKLVNWLYAEVDNVRSELIEPFVALWS